MAENHYDLDYTGSMVDRILDTGYDLQNQGYIFRGLASHYTGTPTERTWLIAPTGSTGFGLSSPVPPGSIGICMYNGSSWSAEVLNTLTLDSAPTAGSGNGITSGAVKTLAESITNAIGQLEQSVSDRFTSMELEDTTGSLQAELLSITLKYVFEGEEETLTSLSILAATAEKAGLMSAADKQKLDAFVTNIRSLRIQDTTAQADQGTEITNTLKWTIGGVTEAITAFTLYAATTSKAGLMSAADKTALDTLPSLINAGYLYAGIATPSTVPSSTSAKIYYIAIDGGTYTSFNLNVTQGINIIYKSGNAWSVAQVVGIDNEPTAGSDNLVKSGGVKTELALGAVYDVSAHNNGATFESLSALLSDTDLNALIPTAVRKGGMSIKFVQSSDNKYVQYRLMSETFNTTVANWQGVDNAPTAGSNNLITSGGVFKLGNQIIVEAGLTIDFSFNVKMVDYPLYGLKAGQKIYVTVVQGPSDPYTSVFTFNNSGQQVEELGSGLRSLGQEYSYTLHYDADKLTFYQNGTANQLKVDVRFEGALDSLKSELETEIDTKASISSVASLSDIVDTKAGKDSVDTLFEIVESDFSSLEEITIQDERPITKDASYMLIESVKGNTDIVGSSFENMNAESIKSYDGSDDEIGEVDLQVSEHYEGGMKSAGSIYDELFNGKAIQRIDVLNLGTLTWVKWGASGVVGTFAASFNKAATGGSVGNQNIQCIPYSSTRTAANIYNGTIDKAINVSSSFQGYDTIVIRDSAYSTPADFKTAMNGVLLYYQMRNYVETPANTSFLIPIVNGGKIVLQSTGSTTAMNASVRFKEGVDEKLAQKADKSEVDALEIEVGKKLTENNIIAGDNITITKNGKNCTISAPSSSALPDNSVTNSKLASDSVSPEKFNSAVVPYIASQVGSQITNFPDNITIESVNNLLKLKDYAVPVNGMGYKLISSAANLTQSLAQSWANCIVEIKAALTVTNCYSIPNTAILYFNGGCFIFNENSYKINARGVRICAEPYQIFYGEPNFNYAGGFDNPQGMIANVGYGEWFGAKGDGESFDAAAFRNLSMHVSCNEIHLLPNRNYVFESWVRIFSTLKGASNAKIVRYNGFVDIPVTSAIATQSSGKITVTVDDSDDTYGALKVGMGVIFAQRPGVTRDVEGSGIRYVTAINGNQVSFDGMGVGKAFAANTASVVSAYPLIILYNSAQLIGVEIDGGLGASSAESVYPYNRTFWEYDQSIGVTYGVNAVVKDCRIYNSLADAIECGGKNTKIEHNFIMHCGSGGIHLSGIDNCEIVDNFIFDTNVNLQTGHNEGAIIYSNQIYGVFIHNNTIDNCLTGIGDMSDSENCKNIITDNVFKNFRNNGLDILIGDAGGAAFGRLLRDVIIRGNRFIGSQDNELSHEWEPTPYVARQETSGYGVAVTKASGASASDVNFKNILIDGNIFVDCGVKMDNTKNGIISNNTFESLHTFTGTHPSQMFSISNAYVNIVGNILRVTSAIITKLVVVSGGKVNLSNTIYEASVGLVDSGANVNEDNNISI